MLVHILQFSVVLYFSFLTSSLKAVLEVVLMQNNGFQPEQLKLKNFVVNLRLNEKNKKKVTMKIAVKVVSVLAILSGWTKREPQIKSVDLANVKSKMFNVSLLKPHHSPSNGTTLEFTVSSAPDPDDKPEVVVEQITRHRRSPSGELEWEVHWSDNEVTWERMDSFLDVTAQWLQYNRDHKVSVDCCRQQYVSVMYFPPSHSHSSSCPNQDYHLVFFCPLYR